VRRDGTGAGALVPTGAAGGVTQLAMRQVGLVAATFLLIACGPDPNAQLPGVATPRAGGANGGGLGGAGGSHGATHATGGSGGNGIATSAAGGSRSSSPTGTGGKGGSTMVAGGSGGQNPFGSGGSSLSDTGGSGGAGGGDMAGSGGSGGVAPQDSASASGGSAGGMGGTTTPSSGALAAYTFGTGAEPCTPTKDVSGGQSGPLGAGAVCLRTADDFTDWNCTGMDDRTIKIDNEVAQCGTAPPAKLGSFYYFDISAGATAWASFSWFCTKQGCGPHPIPSCGHYPPWQSGGTAAPCADTTAPSPDAAITGAPVDAETGAAVDEGG